MSETDERYSVDGAVYESAVKGRAAFRTAFSLERKRARLLAAALRKHHDWHLAKTDEDEHGIVPADAYAESQLCDETIAALDAPSPPQIPGEQS